MRHLSNALFAKVTSNLELHVIVLWFLQNCRRSVDDRARLNLKQTSLCSIDQPRSPRTDRTDKVSARALRREQTSGEEKILLAVYLRAIVGEAT